MATNQEANERYSVSLPFCHIYKHKAPLIGRDVIGFTKPLIVGIPDVEKEREVILEIQMNDDVAAGRYMNMAVVNHNDTEFVIDCIYVQPQAPKARVQSRLITSPRHAKRLLLALQNNIDSFEKKYGAIDLVDVNSSELSGLPMH